MDKEDVRDLVLGICGGIAIGAAIALASFPETPKSPNWDKIAEWDSVLVGDSAGKQDFCSGTIIGGGRDQAGDYSIILTAAHCAGTAGYSVNRKIDKGLALVIDDRHPAVFLGSDAASDVMILRSNITRDETCVPVAKEARFNRGSEVYVLGNPRIQFYAALSKGIVSTGIRSGPIERVPLTMWDAQVAPGSSGGAALDSHGTLIGTVTAVMPGTSFSWMAPVSSTNALIEKLSLEKDICRG